MKTLIFDWDGTIARKEIASIAAVEEMNFLNMEITMDEMHEHQKDHSHYNSIRESVKKIVGNIDDVYATSVMTNLFQYFYLKTANDNTNKIFYEEMFEILKELKKDYKIIIASNLRNDILEPLVSIHMPGLFDEIFANTPDLKYSKTELVKKACEKYDCLFMIGDREDDINAGKQNNLKTVLVNWGYSNGENCNPTYKISNPNELINIFKI